MARWVVLQVVYIVSSIPTSATHRPMQPCSDQRRCDEHYDVVAYHPAVPTTRVQRDFWLATTLVDRQYCYTNTRCSELQWRCCCNTDSGSNAKHTDYKSLRRIALCNGVGLCTLNLGNAQSQQDHGQWCCVDWYGVRIEHIQHSEQWWRA
jgi:hypothetical protein